MSTPNLDILSDKAFIELGARLEVELSEIAQELGIISTRLEAERMRLLTPGIKLALSVFSGVAGIALVPVTFGWSLLGTVISAGVTIHDTYEFVPQSSELVGIRLRIRRLRALAQAICDELGEIETLLTKRFSASDETLS